MKVDSMVKKQSTCHVCGSKAHKLYPGKTYCSFACFTIGERYILLVISIVVVILVIFFPIYLFFAVIEPICVPTMIYGFYKNKKGRRANKSRKKDD
jgi:uncharacterized protein HemY